MVVWWVSGTPRNSGVVGGGTIGKVAQEPVIALIPNVLPLRGLTLQRCLKSS